MFRKIPLAVAKGSIRSSQSSFSLFRPAASLPPKLTRSLFVNRYLERAPDEDEQILNLQKERVKNKEKFQCLFRESPTAPSSKNKRR